MREPTRRGPAGRAASDNDGEDGGFRAPARARGSRAEELLEMADAMEEQGRALLTQARQLQRIAQGLERGGGEDRPAPRARPERSERPERTGPPERSAPRYGTRGGTATRSGPPSRSGPGPRGTAARRDRDDDDSPRESKPRRGPGKPPGKGPARGPSKGPAKGGGRRKF
jgi:hypothetical protein